MGTDGEPSQTPTPTGLADALFSPVLGRVLGYLFGQPDRRFGSSELIDLVGSGTGATHRVIKRLARSGLVIEEADRGRRFYRANRDSPVFESLSGLVARTVGPAHHLREALLPLGDRIRAAMIYGSVARAEDRADSDIDLLVVAEDLDYPTLYEALQPAEHALGRRIDPRLITPTQWTTSDGRSAGFVRSVRENPRLHVLGSDDDAR